MKKILASFLCLAFVLSITLASVGCGGSSDKKGSTTTAPAPAKDAEKKDKAP